MWLNEGKLVSISYRSTAKGNLASHTKEAAIVRTLDIQAITEMGCVVYASIDVSEDYTMNQVVREVKRVGYKSFRLVDTMKRFVDVY